MTKKVTLFESDNSHGAKQLKTTVGTLDDAVRLKICWKLKTVRELVNDDIELLNGAGEEFDLQEVLQAI
jgi:peptide subunit release factor RF-3